MNILFYLSRFPGFGGIETVTNMIGCRLAEMGHQISLITHVRQERPLDLMTSLQHYYIMPEEGQWDTPVNRDYAIQVVKENHFDVIILQDSYAPFERIAVRMKEAMGNNGRLLVFEHSTPLRLAIYYREQESSLIKKLYHRFYSLEKNRQRYLYLLKNADEYIVLAKGNIDELKDVCGRKAVLQFIDKIHYINNPIPSDKCVIDFSKKENIILFVGQLTENKSVGLMLDIWKRLRKQYDNWKFLIVGDGPVRHQLEERVISEKIERVEFCGYQAPSEYYCKAKIFWMASRFEGWGLTIVESMRCGCVPVAMGTYSSVYDIIDSGLNGYITPANNIESFIKATSELMVDDNRRNEFAVQAISKAEKFELNNIINEWTALLNIYDN